MSERDAEPVSWLLLERYALGELSVADRADVERRLAASEADRTCLDLILSDRAELPELPLPSKRPIALVTTRPRSAFRVAIGSAMAIAAAMTLVFLREPGAPPSRRQVYDGTKGGEVALSLHSASGEEDVTHFAQGERFKLLVTCPAWLDAHPRRMLVFQSGQRYEPLASRSVGGCGNHVPWPGAFALDGDEHADVCITWADPARVAASTRATDLEPEVVCARLAPR